MMVQVNSCARLAAVILWCVVSSDGLRHSGVRPPEAAAEGHNKADQPKNWGGHNTVVSKRRPGSWKADEPGYRHVYADDWASGISRMYHNISSPPCVRDAVSKTGGNCKFLTQTICGGEGAEPVSKMGSSHQTCLSPKLKCAVVGSSQHLLSVDWGRKIDRHDWVIRINAAPAGTKDSGSERHRWARHAGTRTDVRFVNAYGSMPEPRESPRDPLCVFLHEPRVRCGKFCWRSPGLCNITCGTGNDDIEPLCASACNVSRLTCKGAQMKQEKEWHKNDIVFMDHFHGGIVDQVLPHATAGFKAVVYAMLTCKQVSVFGFGPGCDGSVGARYYENDKEVFGWHHYDEEIRIMKQASEAPNKKEGVHNIMPPELQGMVRARRLDLMLPECVGKHPEMKRLVNKFMYALNRTESPADGGRPDELEEPLADS